MKERLKKVPLRPGVYIFKDKDQQVLYVGKAKILRQRLRSYFQAAENLEIKVRALMKRVVDFDYIVTGNEIEALILENNLIKSYQPRYNIQLRDDKTYPYLKISLEEEYPRLLIVREKKHPAAKYFGPFPNVTGLRDTVKLLNRIFPLRTCKNLSVRKRPCLNYDIGKCLAPCQGKISPAEYQTIIQDLIEFLEGDSTAFIIAKEQEMQVAAQKMEFEKAARLRDQVQGLKKMQERQNINTKSNYSLDVISMVNAEKEDLILVFKIRAGRIIAKDTYWLKKSVDETDAEVLAFFIRHYYESGSDFPLEILVNLAPDDISLLEQWLYQQKGKKIRVIKPQRGEKKRLLDMATENAVLLWEEKNQENLKYRAVLTHLAEVLELEELPNRIECYDISHLGGQETVAAMVVFSEGQADKKNYRRFKISQDQNDDFASLSEAIRRRFTEAQKGNKSFLPEPDLILIDGGLGQVNAVKAILNDLEVEIPLFSLAEKNEEIYKPGIGTPLRLPRRDEALRLLQQVRDEAHRFAIEYHRQRRGKKIIQSQLDNIPGIGVKRKKALLQHFGSVSRIQQAAWEELSAVPGINKKVAADIYQFFHK